MSERGGGRERQKVGRRGRERDRETEREKERGEEIRAEFGDF